MDFLIRKKKTEPSPRVYLGFASGVPTLLPEKGALIAHRHAQTSLSFGASLVPLLAKVQLKKIFSNRMHVLLVGPRELSTLDKDGIYPIRFYVKIGGFRDVFAPRVLNI